MTVADAVRISSARVRQWWDGEGIGERARQGKVLGGGRFRVVTGRGVHSVGGRGRLGPAVAKRLVAEGWRVEVGEGVVEVLGRVRR